MLWCYDSAIVDDLRDSFIAEPGAEPAVCVISPENVLSIAAQIQDDQIHFPVIAVSRNENTPVDSSRLNYTRLHDGVATVFNKETNELYYENVLPIKLEYDIICMSTNTADVDELIRELLFKYTTQYFLTIKIPYESKRKIRFGVRIDPNAEIQRYTTTSNYLQEGKLHSAGIHVYIDGAVLITYTPAKLKRTVYDVDIEQ